MSAEPTGRTGSAVGRARSPISFAGIWRTCLGLSIGCVFAILVVRMIDPTEAARLVSQATPWPVVFAFAALVLDFLLRAVRFWLMLRIGSGRDLPFGPTIAPFVASFGVNDVLPLRVGDGLRVLWFVQRFSLPAGTVVGTMVVERLLDLASILALAIVGVFWLGSSAPSGAKEEVGIVLALALAASVTLLVAAPLLHRLVGRISRTGPAGSLRIVLDVVDRALDAISAIGSPMTLLSLGLMSVALWMLEGLVVVCAWISLGGSTQWIKPFLAFAFSTLGTLVPSLPGHFGAYEFFGAQGFALAGVDPSLAAMVLLLSHLILWAPTAAFGIVWLLLIPRASRSPVTS